MNEIILPTIIVSVIAVFFGVLLVFASKKLAVEVDERVTKVRAALPGANCGGCGYASCDNYAEAIVNDGAPVNACGVGGGVAVDAIANIMGVEAGEQKEVRAYVCCHGCAEKPEDLLDYRGIKSCRAVADFYGGRENCTYGCVGYGDCVVACPFDAISIKNAVAVVDHKLCTGCLACASACPKGIISTLPVEKAYVVACRNHEQGKYTRVSCTRGCIGCKKCEKVCEAGAITVDGFLARIDHSKCTLCGACAEGCPVHCIYFVE